MKFYLLLVAASLFAMISVSSANEPEYNPDEEFFTIDPIDYQIGEPLSYVDIAVDPPFTSEELKNMNGGGQRKRMALDQKVVKKRDAKTIHYPDYYSDEYIPEEYNPDEYYYYHGSRKRMIKNAGGNNGVDRKAPAEKVVKKRQADESYETSCPDDYYEDYKARGMPSADSEHLREKREAKTMKRDDELYLAVEPDNYDDYKKRMIEPGNILERMILDQRARAKDTKKDKNKKTEDEYYADYYGEGDYNYGEEGDNYNEEDYNYGEPEYDYKRRK